MTGLRAEATAQGLTLSEHVRNLLTRAEEEPPLRGAVEELERRLAVLEGIAGV